MSEIGQLTQTYTKSGLPRFAVEVAHGELHKYQVIKGDSQQVVWTRALAKAAEWDSMWQRRIDAEERKLLRALAAQEVADNRQTAFERTAEARAEIDALGSILQTALEANCTVDWEALKDRSSFPVPRPESPKPPAEPVKPQPHPEPTQEAFNPKFGVLDYFSATRRQTRQGAAAAAFAAAHAEWEQSIRDQEAAYAAAVEARAAAERANAEQHAREIEEWERQKQQYCAQQHAEHIAIDERAERYRTGIPRAIESYCCRVLDTSEYPDCFPQEYELEYLPSSRMLVIDYQLPSPQDLPTVVEVSYIASRDEFREKTVSERQLSQIYESVLYQTVLRTLHELFESDTIQAIEAVNINGWVQSVDPSTGKSEDSCVLSVRAMRTEFLQMDLAHVDPKACFKKLRGVSASRIHSLTPVAPLLTMSREDKRFTTSYEVAARLSEGENIAAMDWEDFEHLIRELFEKEFAVRGAEVRVTQASRDGGVDAVIFDPDPLHGGKTVVQAKRYTNTVSVSAVRDLYGTMMNEGANKGILVTTAEYGPDAYDFATGKPLVLLNGGNLLHLLAKHGHVARIDLKEAKLLGADQDRPPRG
ncbi:MAG: restriction endonuclease [Clostridiales bacterium]|nr:restriction endonuclease [Clostridiales bacterium]